jgi:hypothetical protein
MPCYARYLVTRQTKKGVRHEIHETKAEAKRARSELERMFPGTVVKAEAVPYYTEAPTSQT